MKYREFKNEIQFTNEGQVSLFFLGAGSAFTKTNFQTNFLIIKGKDHLLVDCGTLCPFAFHQLNSKITNVKNILITHSHADHIGGLEEVALMNMYVTKTRPKMVITDEYKKILWQQSLRGGLGLRGEDGLPQKMHFEDYFEQIKPKKIATKPRPFYEATVGTINVKIFRTKHLFCSKNNWNNSFYSVGILIDNRILFTGDSKTDIELINWICKDFPVEYILHDCQFGTNAVHAGFSELDSGLSSEQKSKTLLCHYNDGKENEEEFVKSHGFLGLIKRGIYYDL